MDKTGALNPVSALPGGLDGSPEEPPRSPELSWRWSESAPAMARAASGACSLQQGPRVHEKPPQERLRQW